MYMYMYTCIYTYTILLCVPPDGHCREDGLYGASHRRQGPPISITIITIITTLITINSIAITIIIIN